MFKENWFIFLPYAYESAFQELVGNKRDHLSSATVAQIGLPFFLHYHCLYYVRAPLSITQLKMVLFFVNLSFFPNNIQSRLENDYKISENVS